MQILYIEIIQALTCCAEKIDDYQMARKLCEKIQEHNLYEFPQVEIEVDLIMEKKRYLIIW